MGRNLEKAGAASGTCYQARHLQDLRVEVPKGKKEGRKARWLQKNRHGRAHGRRNDGVSEYSK